MPMVDIEWLSEHVEVPQGLTYEQLAQDLVKVGFEEEEIHSLDISGPLVVGYVVDCVEEPQKNGKIIHWCHIDVGEEHNAVDAEGNKVPRGIVCGAPNIAQGEKVVVALPGAVLPGDFHIDPRKTYGHISEGMCASERELGLSDDHNGIILLKNLGLTDEQYATLEPGTDALKLLHLDDKTLEINITPDRGYAFSYRGLAREYHHSTGAQFTDKVHELNHDSSDRQSQEFSQVLDGDIVLDDNQPIRGNMGCDRFSLSLVDVDPPCSSPQWLQKRLKKAGMRPLNPVVDITNYVMLDLGQPMHAYDYDLLELPIVVRRAKEGEKTVTLDGKERILSSQDLVVADSPNALKGSRVLAIAGVMGCLYGEVTENTRRVLLEAAHFDPVTVARSARRHKLHSEASKRFERGVDPQLAAAASEYAVQLLENIAHGEQKSAMKEVNELKVPQAFVFKLSDVERICGLHLSYEKMRAIIEDIGCTIVRSNNSDGSAKSVDFNNSTCNDKDCDKNSLLITAPSWRPDLKESCDIVEEIARLVGYDAVPVRIPHARVEGDGGLSHAQRVKRAIADEFAQSGLVEALTYPFVGKQECDLFGWNYDEIRSTSVNIANPLAGDKPLLRKDILATLAPCVQRNIRRGLSNIALYELGHVYIRDPFAPVIPSFAGSRRPSDEELAQLDAGLPHQPLHCAAILTGLRQLQTWLELSLPVDWTDGVDLVNRIAERIGLNISYDQKSFASYEVADAEFLRDYLPVNINQWHPGRTAFIQAQDSHGNKTIVGIVGEIHPHIAHNLGFPEHSVALELDIDKMIEQLDTSPVQVKPISTFPPVHQDLAFVVPSEVTADELRAVIADAAGHYLEDISLFDVFTSQEQLGENRKSLAFSLTLRASDKTLEAKDIEAIRTAIVDAAARKDAFLRS